MANRQLPQSTDIEMALLGSMLIYPSAVETAVEFNLDPNDFYLPQNKIIFKTILSLFNEKKPVDVVSLSDRLEDLKQINEIGGQDYISQLADTAGSSATAKYYVNTIQEKARLRDLIMAAEKITQDSFDSQFAMNEVMDKAEKELLKVTRNRKATTFISSKEAVNETIANIKKMSENHTPVTGMKTNYRNLDRITNGFQKGDFIVLAARPSMGKTALALNFAMNIAECNKLPVALFSLEMDSSALVKRMLSAKSKLDGNKLRSGYGISNQEMNSLIEASNTLKEYPIFFNDNSNEVTLANIAASCRKLQSEHGLGCIIIDYIQLMSSPNRNDSRQQEVSEISRGLKGIARELQVPVIALSQLSRSVESRKESKRPMLSDLRESGAIEQDADMVIFLYRESYYAYLDKDKENDKYEQAPDTNGVEEMEVIIAKHRNGPTDTIKLAYQRAYNAFYDFDNQYQEG